jgi:hypothetical protein
MVAPVIEKINAAYKADGGFDLTVPFPFLLEPVARPWLGWRYGNGQIVPVGVGSGVGTASAHLYCKFLEGIELVTSYNTRFAADQQSQESYIEQAGAVKTFLLQIRRFQEDADTFREIQQSGVNWASSTFTHYLMAGLDEAYAIAIYSESCDTMDMSTSVLCQLVAPLVNFKKAREGWQRSLPSPKFGHYARLRAYHGCLAFCLQHQWCPWHGKRVLSRDGETGEVMQVCLRGLRETDAFVRMEKRVTAFLRGCTLQRSETGSLVVEDLLINWLETSNPTFVSKSAQLMHNMQRTSNNE